MATGQNEDLAILNLHRCVLEGPQYLDHMINTATDDQIAVEYFDKDDNISNLTYRELELLSNTLAWKLKQQLSIPDHHNPVIPVLLPQHPALYVSYLAVLKHGAAFCPILPDTPPERIKFILEDIGATVGLCWLAQKDALTSASPQVNWISVDWPQLVKQDQQSKQYVGSKETIRKPSDIAYVMYTSGSTGQPKGVPISHNAVTQSLLSHDEHIPHFERFLQFAAPTFDVSIFEVFFPFFRGSTLVCCERDRMLTDLPGLIEKYEIDACELTPTVVRTLLSRRSSVPNLKILLTIGEMLHAQTIAEFGGNDNQESILFAMYGPTEATIHCTIVPYMSSTSSVHNIGKPLCTVTCFILDDSGNVTRKGETGELAVSGQLAEGYLNRDQTTRTCFVEVPGYGRLYKTGDRAILTAHQDLHIHGRIASGQVKVRGQRIELGEIEQAAYRHDKVELAVALVIQDSIVLFCSGSSLLSSQDVDLACKSWLPKHMMPADIIILPHGFPRLASGKLDRTQLEAIYNRRECTEDEGRDGDINHVHIYLRDLISTELGVKIHARSPLRKNGLDSLRAIRIASKLRQRYPSITLSTILGAENLLELMSSFSEKERDDCSSTEIEGANKKLPQWLDVFAEVTSQIQQMDPKFNVEEILPCSPIQIAMLTETVLDSKFNFNTIALSMEQRYSFDHFLQAFSKLANRTPILRTGFLSTHTSEIPYVQLIKETARYEAEPSLLCPIRIQKGTEAGAVTITIHHAVYDGWSWDLIMVDLNRVISGLEVKHRPSFHDCMKEQQSVSFDDIQSQLTIWVDTLKDFTPAQFPVLRAEEIDRPDRITYSSQLDTSLPTLSEFTSLNGISNPSVVHSALVLLLSQLLDTKTVTTGLVLAGRDRGTIGVEEVIGPLLTTLPLSAEINESQTTNDFVRHVYQQQMHCMRSSVVSLAQIKSALKMETALFDVVFVWQQSLYSAEPQNEVRLVDSKDNLRYALLVEVEPKADRIYLKTTYDTSKLDAASIRIFHAQLNAILLAVIGDMSRPLAYIIGGLDQHLLAVVDVESAEDDLPDLTSTIAKLANTDSDRVAIEFVNMIGATACSSNRTFLTYKELHLRSREAANLLHTYYEMQHNETVAFWCEKSIDVYVAICAAIQAGVVYLCIDSRTPMSRVREILRQSNAKLLLVDETVVCSDENQLPTLTVKMVEFIKQSQERRYPNHNSQPPANLLAYTVFTSGSTGVPKGVLVDRRNLMSNIQALAVIYPYSTSSKLLQSCSLAFDVSVFEIFWTWHCGLTLCTTRNDILFEDIESFIHINGITHLSMTPSVAALVRPENVPKVEFLVCSGEPMSRKVFETWSSHGLYQGYGPSETTNICNVRHYRNGRSNINNVGPAFPNTSLYVCKRLPEDRTNRSLEMSDFELLVKGAAGEVWIGGAQVGRGYTDETLTSRSWLDHPQFGRLYRSGDIGRLLGDDSLVVVGREDDQAKIRGLRIELNEVNARLIDSTHIHDCYTMILKDEGENGRLVAFWVTASTTQDHRSIINDLYSHLIATLPTYMIPEILVPVQALPVTRQGKIDKQALRVVYDGLSRIDRDQYSESPMLVEDEGTESKAHATITAALSRITKIPTTELNSHASFFNYGIDSICAIPFAQTLRQFDVGSVTVSDVLRYSSVHRLASYLERRKLEPVKQSHKIDAKNVIPASLQEEFRAAFRSRGTVIRHVLPCSPLQQAMLSAPTSCNGEDSYVNRLTYRLGSIRERIKDAWATMVRRHEILRTIFALTQDQNWPFIQGVSDDFSLMWTESSTPPSGVQLRPYEAPPYCLHLERQNNGDHVLHLLMHHVLFDAEALSIMHNEIEVFCRGDCLSKPTPFSAYLESVLNTDSTMADQFWSRYLRDIQLTRFTENQAATKTKNRAIMRRRKYPLTYSQLLSYARRTSTTLLAILQVTLARLLFRIFEQQDVCFGTVYSGRSTDTADIENIVGPCFNTLPTRVKVNAHSTVADQYRSLQHSNSAILSFQGTALRDLQRLYSQDGQRLFDIILLLQSPLHRLDNEWWCISSETGQMDFPFIFEIQPDPRLDIVEISLHSSIARVETLDVILADYFELLGQTISNSSSTMLGENQSSAGSNSRIALEQFIKHTISNGSDASNLPPDRDEDHETLTVKEIVLSSVKDLSRRRLKTVAINSDIYQLGLDSISAAQLGHKLKTMGYNITTADILEHPKISSIIQKCVESMHSIAEVTHEYDDDILSSFDQKHREFVLQQTNSLSNDIEAIWPCTSTQLGILSEYSKSDGGLYYNIIRLSLNADTEKDRVFEAWKYVSQRHTMLRTGFIEVDDESSPFAMIVYDIESRICQDQDWLYTANQKLDSTKRIDTPPWSLQYVETEESRRIEWSILHALYDAQSLQIILTEIVNLYHGIDLPPVVNIRNTLRDVLRGNRNGVADDSLFLEIKDIVHPTKFPDLKIEYQVPSKLRQCRSRLKIELGDIQANCEDLSCTVSIACQAAWAQLLASYTGQNCVAFANVLSTRSDDSTPHDLVFPYINILPVLVDTSADRISLIRQLSRLNAELHKNIHVPASRIRQLLSVEGDLFDTIFAFQQSATFSDTQELWSVSDEASAEYAVSVEIIPDGQHLILQVTYDENRLPDKHAPILLEQYEESLRQILGISGAADSLTQRSKSVSKPRYSLISSEHNGLHDLFLASLARNPDATALEYISSLQGTKIEKQTWSYSEVAMHAAVVAQLITDAGVSPGSLIAVCFDKCPEASIALLAILISGCAYVAIDPSAPFSRQQFILEDASCELLLTMATKVTAFKSISKLKTIKLDRLLTGQLQAQTWAKLTRLASAGEVCYCLYTSGTTGTPKGCLISHRSAVQAMLSFSRIFHGRWNPQSRWLQFAAYHFDVSVLEHFWTWKEGLCVTVIPLDLLFDDLPGTIDKLGITHLDLTPSLARLLTPEAVPSLCQGVFIVGGEQVGQDIIETWGDTQCLYNFYGPSEVTIGCTVHPQVRRNIKATNIGRTWDNVGAYVMQPDTEDIVMVGGVGELCLSGSLVGLGYLNRPDLTGKKFVELDNGDRIYRTGDLVRMLHDGSFDFLGRIDDQVKLRGQRLEIGEINSVLKQGSRVFVDAVAMILAHPEQEKEAIVGFLALEKATRVRSGKPSINPNDASRLALIHVRRYAIEHLPGYMIPTYLLAIDSLPLTANNKADHRALKGFYESLSLQEIRRYQDYKEQLNSVSTEFGRLVQIITQHLGIQDLKITPDTSLIQLGVDSIAAIRLSRELRSRGYTGATVATLMRYSNVNDLADVLTQNPSNQPLDQNGKVATAMSAIAQFAAKHQSYILKSVLPLRDEIDHIAPCTALQQGMISHVLGSESSQPPYLNQWAYVLRSETDLHRLREAWTRAANHFDILRTCFVSTDDGYSQVVLKRPVLPIHLKAESVNLAKDSNTGKPNSFSSWVQSTRRLDASLPWAVYLSRHADMERKYMHIYMFHGLYDGISFPLLLEFVAKLYRSSGYMIHGVPSFHDSLAFGPLAVYNDSASRFWKANLMHVRLLDIDTSQIEPEPSAPIITTRVVNSSELQRICQTLSVTAQAVFHALWLVVLVNTFQVNPTIGVVFSGRLIELEDVDKVIGPLFNTLPVTTGPLKPDATFTDLVKACHNKVADMLPYQHSPLSEIRKSIKLPRVDELFNSLFVYQGESTIQHEEGKELWTEEASESNIDVPLNFEVQTISPDTYQLKIAAKPSSQVELDVWRLIDNFENILNTVTRNADTILPTLFWATVSSEEHQTPDSEEQSEGGLPIANTDDARAIREVIGGLVDTGSSIGDYGPNIFELGLDSLDAIKIAARLKKYGILLPVSQILRHPTVSGMARQWSTQRDSTTQANGFAERDWYAVLKSTKPEIEHIDMVLPATNMQEGLLLDFEQYHNVLIYRVADSVQEQDLAKALRAATSDFPIFRTKFIMLDKRVDEVSYVQAIARVDKTHSCGAVETVDVSDLEALQQHVDALKENGCLQYPAKISVVQVNDGSKHLVLCASHALYDGWSLELLLQHIQQLCEGRNVTPTELSDVASFVTESRRAAINDSAIEFWTRKLANVRPTNIMKASSDAEAVFRQSRSQIDTRKLQKVCQKLGITMQSVTLAAWHLMLIHLTGRYDVNFGVVLSGRDSEETERLIFPTFNTVIFRADASARLGNDEFLRTIHQTLIEIYEYQHFPLSKSLRIARNGQDTVFNTLFTFQKTPELKQRGTSIFTPAYLKDKSVSPPYSVNIEAEEHSGFLIWTIATQAGVMSAEKAVGILDELDKILIYLADRETTSIFEAMDGQTKVCGLPSTQVAEAVTESTAQRSEMMNGSDSEGGFSEQELVIRDTLAQASGTDAEDITRHTNIFSLGLDSISAISISRMLRNKGLPISVSTILKKQRVSDIAASVQAVGEVHTRQADHVNAQLVGDEIARKISSQLVEMGIPGNAIEAILPTSGGQDYMLDMWRASNEQLMYGTFWLKIEKCSARRFKEAFSELIRCTPILRTQFLHHDGQYFQVVLKHSSGISGALHYKCLSKDGSVIFTLHIHHALYDAVSLGLMLHELQRLYTSPESITRISTDATDFLRATIVNIEAAQGFWMRYLQHVEPVDLPGNLGSLRSTRYDPSVIRIAEVKQAIRQAGVSVQAILFAAVARVYAGLGQEHAIEATVNQDIAIGIYMGNRSLEVEGLTKLVMPTFNVAPLKVNVSAGRSLIDVAKQVQADLQEIALDERCGRSPREIYKWTGIKLNCVVNFLKLPQAEPSMEPLGVSKFVETASINHATGEAKETAQQLDDVVRKSPFMQGGKMKVEELEWCLPTFDVEAKVDEEGQLAVGMFAPEDMADEKKLQEMMVKLRGFLVSVSKDRMANE